MELPVILFPPQKSQHTQHSHPTSITYSNRTITQSGAPSVTRFLKQQGVLSIKGSSANSSQSDISLHGFGSNASQNSLVLIDGIEDTSESNVGPNLDGLIPLNLSQISILPGSYGARYGSQAVGGVVDFHTLTPHQLIRKVNLSAGNMGQLVAQGLISNRFKNHVGVTLGFSADQHDHTEPHQRQQQGAINSKLDYIGQKGSVSLNFLGYRNRSEIPAGYKVGGGQLPRSGDNHIKSSSGLSYLKGDYFLTPAWQWKTALSNHVTDLDGVMTTAFSTLQHMSQFKNELSYRDEFTVGQKLSVDNYRLRNVVSSQRANDLKQAYYSMVKYPIGNRFSLNAGARAALQYVRTRPNSSRYSDHNSVAVSTIGLDWKFNPHTDFTLRRAGDFRFPDAKEQMWTPTSAISLKVQRGVSYEAAIDWRDQLKEAKVSVYDLELKNELALNPKPTNGSPFPLMSNLPPTRRLGLDTFLQAPLLKSLLINFQAALVRARFKSGQYQGEQVPSVSPIHASTALEYRHDGWHVTVNESYAARYYAANDLSNVSTKMPAIWLTNLTVQKEINKITFGLSINNLFDRRYARYAYYLPAFGALPSEVDYYKADGLSVLANVSVSF